MRERPGEMEGEIFKVRPGTPGEVTWGAVSAGQFRGSEWRQECWDILRSFPASVAD